jgi:hypothetical protein
MCGEYLPGGSGEVGGVNFGDPMDIFGGQKRRDAARLSAEAKAAEAERMGRITKNVASINSAFAGRAPQYAQFGAALRTQLGEGLAKQRETATRQTKFGLAKAGLTGGSAAKDAKVNLDRENTEGVINAERIARKGVADLQGQDEDARMRMISLAQSGNDIGNAAQNTAAMLQSNLSGASAANTVQNLGEVFGSSAAAYRASTDAAQRRRGLQDATKYASAFSRG